MSTNKTTPRVLCALLQTSEDRRWLVETALKADNLPEGYKLPAFRSAIIEGNEDCPTKVWLYAEREPAVYDAECAVLVYLDGVYYPQS